jgi:hypothetical protein
MNLSNVFNVLSSFNHMFLVHLRLWFVTWNEYSELGLRSSVIAQSCSNWIVHCCSYLALKTWNLDDCSIVLRGQQQALHCMVLQ